MLVNSNIYIKKIYLKSTNTSGTVGNEIPPVLFTKVNELRVADAESLANLYCSAGLFKPGL